MLLGLAGCPSVGQHGNPQFLCRSLSSDRSPDCGAWHLGLHREQDRGKDQGPPRSPPGARGRRRARRAASGGSCSFHTGTAPAGGGGGGMSSPSVKFCKELTSLVAGESFRGVLSEPGQSARPVVGEASGKGFWAGRGGCCPLCLASRPPLAEPRAGPWRSSRWQARVQGRSHGRPCCPGPASLQTETRGGLWAPATRVVRLQALSPEGTRRWAETLGEGAWSSAGCGSKGGRWVEVTEEACSGAPLLGEAWDPEQVEGQPGWGPLPSGWGHGDGPGQ